MGGRRVIPQETHTYRKKMEKKRCVRKSDRVALKVFELARREIGSEKIVPGYAYVHG